MPEERLSMLREACSTSPDQARISSAFALAPPQRDTLQHTLQTLLEQPVVCTFEQNPQLLSGLRITIGPWLLRANLRDELMDFTAAAERTVSSTSAQDER
ncbi:MAG: F0F1 ATP synthase subunit delta [Gammaproteobacteria bacterium]